MIRIGEILRDAVLFNPSIEREVSKGADTLLESAEMLLRLLAERSIEYVLVGGVAMLSYVPGRNTRDLGLILNPESLIQLPELYIESQEPDSAMARFEQIQLDLLLTRNPLFDRVRSKHVAVRQFAERDAPCATVEGLVLLKLYALPLLYRQGDFVRVGLYENDIATLLALYRPPVEPLLGELGAFVSETDLAAVRDILRDLQERIRRIDKARKE